MTRLKRRKELPSTHGHDVRFGTPEIVAEYRAQRICGGVNTIVEVGAGAGFQTAAFAKRVDLVIAIDIDAERLGRGAFSANTSVIAGDALDPAVIERARQRAKGRVAVFLDTERPPASKARTLAEISPDPVKFVQQYVPLSQDVAIELPPFLGEFPFACEREYLSIDGELNRLTAYLGRLRRCDISVVQLPSGERIEHTGPLPALRETAIARPTHILVPDRALAHAGLVPLALPAEYGIMSLGNKDVFLTGRKGGAFFRSYRIVGTGERKDIEKLLPRCGKLVLHGRMGQHEQAVLLKELNRHCRGSKTFHLFMGGQWYLAEQ